MTEPSYHDFYSQCLFFHIARTIRDSERLITHSRESISLINATCNRPRLFIDGILTFSAEADSCEPV